MINTFKRDNSHFEFLFSCKRILNSKRSQIGATLSWFVAILIIFFIMVLFLSISIIFSAQKKVISGTDKISLERKNSDLNNYDILLSFLDKKIVFDNAKTSVKNIVMDGLDKEKRVKIKEKLKEELDKLAKENYGGDICYLFDISYPNSNIGVNNNPQNKFDVCSFTCTDEQLNDYVDQYKLRLLSKSISFNLYSEKGVVKTKFYLGEC